MRWDIRRADNAVKQHVNPLDALETVRQWVEVGKKEGWNSCQTFNSDDLRERERILCPGAGFQTAIGSDV